MEKSTVSHSAVASTKSQRVAEQFSTECSEVKEDFQALMEDVGNSVGDYCRKRPMVAALSVFAIGFYLGWKVKPW